MDNRIHYEAFQELFKELGINPVEFYNLSKGKVKGWFPDVQRTPKVDVEEFARVVWGEPKKKGFFKW